MCADVADVASMTALRDACIRDLGRIDIVVAAAGVTKRVPTLQMDEADWDRILDTNLTGVLRTCQVFGATMVEQKRGRIITIASLASFVGLHEVAAYTASKAGVAGLTRALAVEWARHGVTVNAIAPGVFETDLNRELLKSGRGQEFLVRTPMGRFGRVERARRRGGLPGVGCGELHHRAADRGGRRISRERCESVSAQSAIGIKVIVITRRDNVATALEALAPARRSMRTASASTVREPIASGHKIALTAIRSGEPVVKYGNPIGTATVDIAAGAHVHVHNVASARGRGDQARGSGFGDRYERGPGFEGFRAARWTRRRAQSRPRRADRDLLRRRHRAHRGAGAGRGGAAAPGRLRPAWPRHAAHARHAGGVLPASQCRRRAGRGARLRAGGRADAGRVGARGRQAIGDRLDPG